MNNTLTAADPAMDLTTPGDRKERLATTPPLLPHTDLDAWEHTLIFAPHPDDEALGCGGLIALLRARELPVTVVFVSDGAMSHPNSRRYDRAARVALRENEALAACAILGVGREDVHFLRYPDTEVPRHHHPGFEAARDQIARLITRLGASHALVPWRRDPHCDHRATWEICHEAMNLLDSPPKWIEYPIWMWNSDKEAEWPQRNEVIAWRLNVSPVLDQKNRAIAAHRSQVTDQVITDDPEGFTLTEEMLANFRRETELFFEPPTKRFASLGEDYFTKVYAEEADPWSFETSRYERDKYAHSVDALTRPTYDNVFEIGCSIGVLTGMLADRAGKLLAIDTAERPLEMARRRLAGKPHVRFARMKFPTDFPDETYDLIVLSEVGYYLSEQDLARACKKIRHALRPGGQLLLVHFTPYVPDYPLTGDEVHEHFAQALRRGFTRLRADRRERYRLDLYQRCGDAPSA